MQHNHTLQGRRIREPHTLNLSHFHFPCFQQAYSTNFLNLCELWSTSTIHFQPIPDKIKLKLSSWKASLLSLVGKVKLVRSVIQSMLLHCISIYTWPVNLIKILERWIRNFIWSGDINKRKLVTVAWHKVCTPLKEGGLGLRSLSKINEGANLKLCWELVQSNLQWAHFLRNRVLTKKCPISYHISSSIWSSIKHQYLEVTLNSTWLLEDGANINF